METPEKLHVALIAELHEEHHHGWGSLSACVVCRATVEKFENSIRALRESHADLVTAAKELMERSYDAMMSLPVGPTSNALSRARMEMGDALQKAEVINE